MKRHVVVILWLLCSLAAASAAVAQTSKKIFDPVAITPSDPDVDYSGGYASATPFATKQVYLDCLDAGVYGYLSGPSNGNFIVDNHVQIERDFEETQNFCPFIETSGCFNGTFADPSTLLGSPAEAAYGSVGPEDITPVLVPGTSLYSFRLMDWGGTYTSSEIWLNTSCSVKDKVCHYDSGKRTFGTLTVGADAIPGHLNHGDTFGACAP